MKHSVCTNYLVIISVSVVLNALQKSKATYIQCIHRDGTVVQCRLAARRSWVPFAGGDGLHDLPMSVWVS